MWFNNKVFKMTIKITIQHLFFSCIYTLFSALSVCMLHTFSACREIQVRSQKSQPHSTTLSDHTLLPREGNVQALQDVHAQLGNAIHQRLCLYWLSSSVGKVI